VKRKKGKKRVLKHGTNTDPAAGGRIPPKISLSKTPWDEEKEGKKNAKT